MYRIIFPLFDSLCIESPSAPILLNAPPHTNSFLTLAITQQVPTKEKPLRRLV
ncbi:hypothetical protein EVA_16951 [gut metagenome]|uniref:Uncharacterized protein n=1 Tax=gut metagenome TaxID=749906 RepID=J9FZG6_9ZZZZ